MSRLLDEELRPRRIAMTPEERAKNLAEAEKVIRKAAEQAKNWREAIEAERDD